MNLNQQPGNNGKQGAPDPILIAIQEQVKTMLDTVRNIEARVTTMDKKIHIIETNLLDFKKKSNSEVKTIHTSILNNEKEISLVSKNVMKITADLNNFARVEEVGTIRKYLELWKPINFVTYNELDNVLDERNNK